jgi:hypothetical protein
MPYSAGRTVMRPAFRVGGGDADAIEAAFLQREACQAAGEPEGVERIVRCGDGVPAGVSFRVGRYN